MHYLQVAAFASVIIAMLGFVGYTYEAMMGNITRFTRWSDLTVRQWFYAVMQLQIFLIMSIIVLIKLST